MATSAPTIDLDTLEQVKLFLRGVVENHGRGVINGVEQTWDEQQLIDTSSSISQLCTDASTELTQRVLASVSSGNADLLFSALASLPDQRTRSRCVRLSRI
jgi:hypothetical protein